MLMINIWKNEQKRRMLLVGRDPSVGYVVEIRDRSFKIYLWAHNKKKHLQQCERRGNQSTRAISYCWWPLILISLRLRFGSVSFFFGTSSPRTPCATINIVLWKRYVHIYGISLSTKWAELRFSQKKKLTRSSLYGGEEALKLMSTCFFFVFG